jgi:plasmid stability protein
LDHSPQYRPFGMVVRDLLIERGITTRLHNPDLPRFAESLTDVHYETLRKALAGERTPAPKLIDVVAKKLDVDPEVFAEYRLARLRESLDPGQVGIDLALEHLARIEGQLEP